jgi:preprotein translocase subunit Sec61beta
MVKRRKNKVKMPSTGAGLVRYMDEEGRGIKLRPERVMMAAVGVVVLKIALTAF